MHNKSQKFRKKVLGFFIIICVVFGTLFSTNIFALTEPGAFFNDINWYLNDIDKDGHNDTLIVEFDVNFLFNDTAEVEVNIELYTEEHKLMDSRSTTYIADNSTDYKLFSLGPYQATPQNYYFVLLLYDGVNDTSDQYSSDLFTLYSAMPPPDPRASFSFIWVDTNDTNLDGYNDSLYFVFDVDAILSETFEITVITELYNNDTDSLILQDSITYNIFGSEYEIQYIELGPVTQFDKYYGKLILYDSFEDPSDSHTTEVYTLYPITDINATFGGSASSMYEDLDGDGYHDAVTAYFQVFSDASWTISVDVVGTLYDSNNKAVDRTFRTITVEMPSNEYFTLRFDAVDTNDTYRLELVMYDHVDDPSDTIGIEDLLLYAPTNPIMKNWTILVYMDGDNNLEDAALDDLNEIETAGGSTRDINIIAIVDRTEEYYDINNIYDNWTDAKYFELKGGINDILIESIILQELGEVNMGDSQTLRNFVEWGLTHYPATYTALIIWDHGGGLDGVCFDEDNNGDVLTVQELQTALEGKHFDFIGFDACVMNSIEVIYELRNNADYVGASFLSEPEDGYPYDTIISELHTNTSITPEEFSDLVATNYVLAYDIDTYDGVTYSVIDTSKLSNVIQALNAFVGASIDNLHTYNTEIYLSIANSEGYFPLMVGDLTKFLYNIISIYNYVPFASEAMELYYALEEAIILEKDNDVLHDLNGLWIFLPLLPYSYFPDFYQGYNLETVRGYTNYYVGLDFVQNTNWTAFVYQWIEEAENVFKKIDLDEENSYDYENFFFIDLPEAEYEGQFEVILTMEDTVNFDLIIWNELCLIDENLGFIEESMNNGSVTETITITPKIEGRFFIYVYKYSGTGTFTLKIHEKYESTSTTSTTPQPTKNTNTTTSQSNFPVVTVLTLIGLVPIILNRKKKYF